VITIRCDVAVGIDLDPVGIRLSRDNVSLLSTSLGLRCRPEAGAGFSDAADCERWGMRTGRAAAPPAESSPLGNAGRGAAGRGRVGDTVRLDGCRKH